MSFLLLTPDGEVRLLSEETSYEDIKRIVAPGGEMVECVSTVQPIGGTRLNAYVDTKARLNPSTAAVNLTASLVFGRELHNMVVVCGEYDRERDLDTGANQAQLDHVRGVASGA